MKRSEKQRVDKRYGLQGKRDIVKTSKKKSKYIDLSYSHSIYARPKKSYLSCGEQAMEFLIPPCKCNEVIKVEPMKTFREMKLLSKINDELRIMKETLNLQDGELEEFEQRLMRQGVDRHFWEIKDLNHDELFYFHRLKKLSGLIESDGQSCLQEY